MTNFTKAKRIEPISLFKYLAFGAGISWGILGVVGGVLGLFGIPLLTIMGEPALGIPGLINGLLLGPSMGLITAFLGVLFVPVGWRIYRHFFGGTLSVELENDEATDA